jgi:hypothetical protein
VVVTFDPPSVVYEPMSLEAAREHLDLASEQWERAATDAWEPSDAASCITKVFYAYENLIVAVAEARDQPWAKSHYKKADLAAEFAKNKVLSKDLHDEMLRLNDLRKDVSYGEGEDLGDEDLEGLVGELEKMIAEVEEIVSAALEEAAEERADD